MSDLPRFFYSGPMTANETVTLDAATAKHVWQVLRMKEGDKLMLTDGKGTSAEAVIDTAEKHKCTVLLKKVETEPRQGAKLHLCVGFTKNNSRNEWLLEKATELGVASIIPIAAARSEKAHLRHDRWEKILQSAILQSQQNYLPLLSNVTPLLTVIKQYAQVPNKLVAHCLPEIERKQLRDMLKNAGETVLLIGPEGDFTADEVNLCIEHGFTPISLGHQRLRTETAAIAAAACFNVLADGD
jgi:16S rRNA (uracil1498-N3)-methyltransferase